MPDALVKRVTVGGTARHLDVIFVLVATPVALLLGAPALGCLLGAGGWLVQRVLAQVDRRWISTSAQPSTRPGLNLFEAFGRIWLLAGAIVVAGIVGGRANGLAAAVTIFCVYSIAFAVRVVEGRPGGATP